MANRPLKPCNKIGCRDLTLGRYCTEHEHLTDQHRRDRNKHYDTHQRDKDAARFYNSKEWDIARRQRLIIDNGLCVMCLGEKQITSATLVDHIKPLRLFWHLRVTLSNLQSLCDKHHAIKTQEDKREYGGR